MAEILAFCMETRRKTRIMYNTNMSYDQLKAYLAFLTAKNLLQPTSEGYVTTVKGQQFIEALAQVNNLLEENADATLMKTALVAKHSAETKFSHATQESTSELQKYVAVLLRE